MNQLDIKPANSIKRPIYLDYHATTPLDPRVWEAMQPFFTEHFGNPHSAGHAFGWVAEEAVEQGREQVAALINASAKEIIFTSGATEASNMAIKGAARFEAREGGRRKHIVTVATEHKCVLESCKALEEEGFETTILPVRPNGVVELDALRAALRNNTLLVSVMAVNNEIGVIQPLGEIGALCREKHVLFHTDAAQGFGKIPLDVEAMHIDLLSISGHKIYGPKGVGALYVRRRPRVRLEPLFSGGGQERNLRSGTVPTPLVVGLGMAAEVAGEGMADETARLTALRHRFLARVQEGFPHAVLNGDAELRVAGNISLSFPGIAADKLTKALADLAISSSSACSSATVAPSYVLQALGIDEEMARTTIRFGLGRFTTETEVDYAASLVAEQAGALASR